MHFIIVKVFINSQFLQYLETCYIHSKPDYLLSCFIILIKIDTYVKSVSNEKGKMQLSDRVKVHGQIYIRSLNPQCSLCYTVDVAWLLSYHLLSWWNFHLSGMLDIFSQPFFRLLLHAPSEHMLWGCVHVRVSQNPVNILFCVFVVLAKTTLPWPLHIFSV